MYLANTRASDVEVIVINKSQHQFLLPMYFPNIYLVAEKTIRAFLGRIYPGSFSDSWDYYELSNGGFYMAPKFADPAIVTIRFECRFERMVSADVLGIIACLLSYASLMENHPQSHLKDLYWKLRHFAHLHPESVAIFAAVDWGGVRNV